MGSWRSRGALSGARQRRIAIANCASGCAPRPKNGGAGGCPLIYRALRSERWRINHKRVERLYREEGLSLRRRRRRKRLSHLRVERSLPSGTNQAWAMLLNDSLGSGRRYRALAVIDEWSRESLAI